MTEQLMTAKQVAELLQVSPRQVFQLARDKAIPSIRIHTSVRFRKSDLDTWVDAGAAPVTRRKLLGVPPGFVRIGPYFFSQDGRTPPVKAANFRKTGRN
jgi:excisionase family DNA binding protein